MLELAQDFGFNGSVHAEQKGSGKLKLVSFFVAKQMDYGFRIFLHLFKRIVKLLDVNQEVRAPRGQRHTECPGPHSVVLLCPQDERDATRNAKHRVRFL